MSCRITGGDFDSAGQATRGLKEHLCRLGVGAAALRRAMIAAYEAEMNVVIHARTGTLWARLDAAQLDIEVADEGPGIPDVPLALREGWSTASAKAREMGFGAGMGLPNIRRSSDRFDIETRPGRGTRVRSTIFLGGEACRGEAAPVPAIAIDASRCRHCLRCVRACPTAALRVHGRGPALREALCVGCTACIRACPAGSFSIQESAAAAARPATDGSVLIVPAGFFAGAAGRLRDAPAEETMRGLGALGFAEVRVMEEWSQALRSHARRAATGWDCLPLIPPTCPAVIALVESRFPSLIPHLGPWLPPLEAAGEEFPLTPAVLVAPCPAHYASASAASLTPRLSVAAPRWLREALRAAPRGGALPRFRSPRPQDGEHPGELVVTGASGVLAALSAVETGGLAGVSVLDLSLCDHGCRGSALLCGDPVAADLGSRRLVPLLARAPVSDAGIVARAAAYQQRPGLRLHPDMAAAIQALGRIDALTRTLPGRDCAACGAPTCALLAEDVVMGRADPSRCPYLERSEEST